ncbi:hypothetical protein QLG13_28100 (plasmid) [Rhodococcus aetherivorans]|uniref:hypothetical protein n=1 Tax=Rhodococcus aetherivorans TaxID=191292 RepID=UPI0002D23E2E|nr:hypothetical protein [Rhodococcus aetherivorans]CCW15592.1 hypothetical protein EBESD8_61690 [Rhodococcus aetherivorans]
MSIESAMAAGARGELLTGWAIVRSARRNDTGIVIGVYAGAVMVSLVLSATVVFSPAARIAVDLILWAGWAGIAYLFVAIGTKLSHGVATWGIALVAGIIAVWNAVGALIGLSTVNTTNRLFAAAGVSVPGVGTYLVLLLMALTFGALAFFCTVKMYRGMQLLGRASTPQPLDPHPGDTAR